MPPLPAHLAGVCGNEGVQSPSPSPSAAALCCCGRKEEPPSGELLEILGWERDCAAVSMGDLFQGRPSHVSLGTHRCQAARAVRKQFSHLMPLPEVWEAVMFC